MPPEPCHTAPEPAASCQTTPEPAVLCRAALFPDGAAPCPAAPILPLPLCSACWLAEQAACLLEPGDRAEPGVLAGRGVGRAASWAPRAPLLTLSPLCCHNLVPCLSAPASHVSQVGW